jgi:hypothetical protein
VKCQIEFLVYLDVAKKLSLTAEGATRLDPLAVVGWNYWEPCAPSTLLSEESKPDVGAARYGNVDENGLSF